MSRVSRKAAEDTVTAVCFVRVFEEVHVGERQVVLDRAQASGNDPERLRSIPLVEADGEDRMFRRRGGHRRNNEHHRALVLMGVRAREGADQF